VTKKTDPPNPPVPPSSPFGASTNLPSATNTTASPSDTIPLATRGVRRSHASATSPSVMAMLTALLPAKAAAGSAVSAEAPADPHEKKSARATKYNTNDAAHWIACAIHVPVEAGPGSAACRELLNDIGLTCLDLGLPVVLTFDPRGVTKLTMPLLGSTLDLVTTGMTLGVWFTYSGQRVLRYVGLAFDAAEGKMVGPNGTDAAEAVAMTVFQIAAEVGELTATTSTVPAPSRAPTKPAASRVAPT